MLKSSETQKQHFTVLVLQKQPFLVFQALICCLLDLDLMAPSDCSHTAHLEATPSIAAGLVLEHRAHCAPLLPKHPRASFSTKEQGGICMLSTEKWVTCCHCPGLQPLSMSSYLISAPSVQTKRAICKSRLLFKMEVSRSSWTDLFHVAQRHLSVLNVVS